MNEVTRIHLGRQPFTASVEAHRLLKAYIAAIQAQVHDADVIEEVELRMAELLTEHGITGEKVVLEQDVDYLKQQLGDPQDFTDSNDDTPADKVASKQLFRDTQQAWVAGVAAGLAAYFGINVWIVRVLFVIGVFTGGWGLLIYILLWLLVPPAVTGSDRLRMHGESVTLGSLKAVVDRSEAKGAAIWTGNTVASIINTTFQLLLRIVGQVLLIGSLIVLFGLVFTWVYMAAHHGQLTQENLFPVGRTEHLLADLILGLVGLLAVFGILCGLAIYKRRWPIRGWATGVIIGVFFLGLAVGGALSVDTVHKVRDRYLSQSHTITRSVQPFQDVTLVGKDIDYRWEYADSYSVSFRYYGNPDVSKIKTTVSNNLLQIDTSRYDRDRRCTMICIFPAYNLLVTVKGPRPLSSDMPDKQAMPAMPAVPSVPTTDQRLSP